MDDVDPVREQVGDLPAAEIEIGAEIPVLLRIVVAPLHRAQEARPVEVGGLGGHARGRFPQVGAVAVPPGARQRDLAELSGLEVLVLGLQVVLAGALLHAHLADAVVDARRLDDRRPFLDLQRQRLLDVDVLAGIQRVDGDAGVPVVGRGDQDRVDLLQLEQLAVVGESF